MARLVGNWRPLEHLWREMDRFQRDMDHLLGRGRTDGNRGLAAAFPPVNVWEDADHIYAEAELPGLKLEDLEIYVTGHDQLAIKGTRQPDAREKAVWHRQERAFGAFTRVLTLPTAVDAAKVEAKLEHGVLSLTLAKAAAAKPRKITVKAE